MGFTHYTGPASAFPPETSWKTFQDIFNANKHAMTQTGDTPTDIGRIWNAVVECAKSEGVDERVVFCVVMQESTGNVGVKTTKDADGKANAGLMQSEGSPGFSGRHGLSQEDITAMVKAGTKHFKGCVEQVGGKGDAGSVYKALRLYNSGSVDEGNLSDGKGATPAYVSDVANRLLGRTG